MPNGRDLATAAVSRREEAFRSRVHASVGRLASALSAHYECGGGMRFKCPVCGARGALEVVAGGAVALGCTSRCATSDILAAVDLGKLRVFPTLFDGAA